MTGRDLLSADVDSTDVPADPPPLSRAADAALSTATVVVVDDIPDNVALLSRLLRGAGVPAVHTFTDARLALERIPALDPDLILLDLHMPGLDGFEFLGALEQALPADAFLPVLVLTADVSPQTRRRALDAGAKDFLIKPIDVDEALQRSRNLLETRALHTELQRHNAELRRRLAEITARAQQDARERALISCALDDLLADGGPTMVFQPVVALQTGAVVGAEALARFLPEPVRTPDTWFADAERVGRGGELELSAIRAASHRIDDLPEGTFLSINASPDVACSPGLGSLLETMPRDRVVLELTEHSQVSDYAGLVAALAGHREAGLRMAIDDTGAGYASFRHLLQLRPDLIKLDISLVRHIDLDPARRALAVALTAFAADVGAVVIAEGIETEGELDVLRQLGVPCGQGYLLARPGPLPLVA